MKRFPYLSLLFLFFFALIWLTIGVSKVPELFSSAMAFPFEQIGAGLRALSLSGTIGNGLALALFGGLGCLPLLGLSRNWRERLWENAALCCLAGLLLFALFHMAEPARLLRRFPNATAEFLPMLRGFLGCGVWSAAVLWLVLRLLRLFRQGDTKTLLGYLKNALYGLGFLFTASAAILWGQALPAFPGGADGAVTFLTLAGQTLSYGLDIAVILAALDLLAAFTQPENGNVVPRAEELSRRCCLSLGVSAAFSFGLNLLYLLLSPTLLNISLSLNIPVVSIAFALLLLLFSRLIVENRRLREDNDLFI